MVSADATPIEMHIELKGTRIWFDVDGPVLVPDGSAMRRRATVVLVHGGPGVFDHAYFKPHFARLAEHVQVVFVDLLGHGRSTWGDAAEWSFEKCADDILAFCETVGIDRPIVLGHSMGGPVVLMYAARHPGNAAGLIVQSGFARFDIRGWPRASVGSQAPKSRNSRHRSFSGDDVTDEDEDRVFAAFGPHVPDEQELARAPQNLDLNEHGMELIRRLDIVSELSRIDCPTLVSVGELDPVTPVGAAEEIVSALPEGIGHPDVINGAGHFPWMDVPERYWPTIIEFIHSTIPHDACES